MFVVFVECWLLVLVCLWWCCLVVVCCLLLFVVGGGVFAVALFVAYVLFVF